MILPNDKIAIVSFPDLVRKIARISLINIDQVEFRIDGFGGFTHTCYYIPDPDGDKDADMKLAENIIYILSNLKLVQIYSVAIDRPVLIIQLNIVSNKVAEEIQDKLDQIDDSFFI